MHIKLRCTNLHYFTNNMHSMKAYNIQTGDIVFLMDTNECYVANKNQEYVKLQCHEQNYHRTRPTNCKNCGAVLTSYKCEYCDTEY